MIHGVITTASLFPYAAKFMSDGARNNKTQQRRSWKINSIGTRCCRTSKISNWIGRIDNFLAKARKLSILPTELDISDIRQHYVCILLLEIWKNILMMAICDCVVGPCISWGQEIEKTYIVLPYTKKKKKKKRLGELIIFSQRLQKYYFSQPSYMDTFDVRLWTYSNNLPLTSDLLRFIISTPTNMNLAVYGNGLAVLMTSWIMLTLS